MLLEIKLSLGFENLFYICLDSFILKAKLLYDFTSFALALKLQFV